MDFVSVSDKKDSFYVRNQRNLSFFSGFRWFLTENECYFLFLKFWWAFTLHCGSLFYIKIPTPQVVPLFHVYPFDLLDFHKMDKH